MRRFVTASLREKIRESFACICPKRSNDIGFLASERVQKVFELGAIRMDSYECELNCFDLRRLKMVTWNQYKSTGLQDP